MSASKSLYEHDGIPVGPLKIIAVDGCQPLCETIDRYIVDWRRTRRDERHDTAHFAEYYLDSYLVEAKEPRFGSGEAKGELNASVRGDDIFIVVDVCNYSVTYKMNGMQNRLSPDDHFQNLKRVIAAVGGKARRINVIMPFLYESRQHLRSGRESLDCALALQELADMGVENIITFDAHDPRVQNAIPLLGFESVMPAYQFIKALVENEKDLHFDKDHMMMISPDEGAMRRVVYFASILGLNAGMFYKRRDYTRIEDGRNPIIAHEFLGQDLEGMDAVLVDDMISSGDSVLEVARELKARKCGRLFVFATFGLFTNGLEKFDRACEEGLIDRIYTTNLIYQMPELADRGWYVSVDMSRYIALLIDTLNHNDSISGLLDPSERIHELIGK
ncbi:MAG: ribose-phosphate pyrophosphokinase [Lachnospiraceae bacterium]|nr:ribose-phosphate pyrophosphokinase [Lachnospiraceae bacterium]